MQRKTDGRLEDEEARDGLPFCLSASPSGPISMSSSGRFCNNSARFSASAGSSSYKIEKWRRTDAAVISQMEQVKNGLTYQLDERNAEKLA